MKGNAGDLWLSLLYWGRSRALCTLVIFKDTVHTLEGKNEVIIEGK